MTLGTLYLGNYGTIVYWGHAGFLGINSRELLDYKYNYLEGQGDLVSRLIMGIIRVTIWVIGIINLLTKSP